MASRESQGLQISLILFVMLSVVLAVLTFVFYRSSQTARQGIVAAEEKMRQANKSLADANFKIQYLRHLLGETPLSEAELNSIQPAVTADPAMTAIKDSYETDMESFGEGLPPEKRNYRDLPVYMMNALKNKNENYAQLAKEVQRLNREKAELQKAEEERTKVAQEGQQKAKDDLAQRDQSYQQQLASIQQMREQEERAKQEQMNKLKGEIAARETALNQKSQLLSQSESTVDQQKQRISELVDQPFEIPDGKIVWVNQQAGLVWINLGKADGLRRQTTFSVFDDDAMNIATRSSLEGEEGDEDAGLARQADNAKAKIEITTVQEDHLAEGRIVEDTAGNPIMPGDQIFSPAWKPGRKVRFVLAGVLDMDGDRRSDPELLRNVIEMGGGAIDEEPTPNTQYLVLGDEPLDRAEAAAYGSTKAAAATLGIQVISLPILLDLMGYKAEVSTMSLNNRRERRGGGNTEPEEGFRERRPPASAF